MNQAINIYESRTQAFIVKIWLENAATQSLRAIWRGHITHVPSGRRTPLHNLDDIMAFIIPYLVEMGIDPNQDRPL